MYITVKKIVGEKTIYLSYPIQNLDGSKEIAIVSIFQDNVTYEFGTDTKNTFSAGSAKSNKLGSLTEMNFCLNELDNSDNLIDGQPSNILLRYKISDHGDSTRFEPRNLMYVKLRKGIIDSLTLSITDQNGDMITNSLGATIVLHIR